MKLNLRLLGVFVALLTVHSLWGQSRNVTGTVLDETGEPLPGASVQIDGTSQGTVTNLEGVFSISVPEENNTLKISFIGFEDLLVNVANKTSINVQLKASYLGLDEVVAVGYGNMKKSDISGASISVDPEKLTANVGAGIDQALQGRAAGINAVTTSGQPGAAANVSIRGVSTLSANAQPLYIVDGVPIQNVSQSGHDVGLGDNLGNGSNSTFSGLSSLNPEDIESVEILKDASATAIYGSRAANGVVIITTKSGKKSQAQFEYNFQYGLQQQAKSMNVLNLRQYAEYSNDYAAETDGRDPRVELMDPSILGDGTNWQGAVFDIAPMQSHQLSASGGNDKIHYFISGSYFDQEGIVVGSNFDRFTTRVNLDAELKSWLKVGANNYFARYNDNIGLSNSTEGIISVALMTSPDVAVYETDGTFSGDLREGSPGRVNPIGKALTEENRLKRTNVRSNTWAEISFYKDLKLRSEVSLDFLTTNAYVFEPTYKYGALVNESNFSQKQFSQNLYWEIKNYLTYSKTIDDHKITAMLGQETSEWMWEFVRSTGYNLPSNDIHEPNLGDTYAVGTGTGSGARVSAFSRIFYGFKDKYNLTYTYRLDGSSNFGPERRWADFHALGTSWRISEESFMENLKPTISTAKLRIGWGQTGNDNIDGYRWGASISKMPTGLGQGYRQSNIANPFIGWESQNMWNFGLDLGIIDDRINLTTEYYIKRSTEMLMQMQLPSYMGTRGNSSSALAAPYGNFGEIENKGWEFSVNAVPVKGLFTWEADLQVSLNQNKLLGLQGIENTAIEGYGQWSDVVSRSEIGQPLYNFYGYKVVGIYQNKQDILDSPRPKEYPEDGNLQRGSTVWVGDLKYADISGPDGKPDGVINEYDKTIIGSPMPDFTFGFNNSFRYRNLELNVFVNGSYGNEVMNYVSIGLTSMDNMWDNQLATVTDRTKLEPIDPNKEYPFTNSFGNNISGWYNDIDNVQIANAGASLPRAISGDPGDNTRISDRYIEDGSYIRIKTINLAYNLPRKWISKVGLTRLKVYGNIQNAMTFTKYSGFDPEIGTSQASDNVLGLDNGRYPSPRIYSFGLNASF